jgi:hypothetical protein
MDIHRRYIPWLLHQLIEEYNIYSSVMKVYLSVITDERVCVSCNVERLFLYILSVVFSLKVEEFELVGFRKKSFMVL